MNVLSENGPLEHPDDGLPQSFFVTAEDGIGGTATGRVTGV